MTDKQKETEKGFSTCFEGTHFAEMMGKMRSGKGVGSLCAEMMQKIVHRQETGSKFDCADMMEKMMTMCRGLEKKEEKAPKE
jgi:hypothetical protein